jgi:hypothetical protein
MALDLARWQFAIITVYHFLFVPLTIGLSFLVAGMQTAWVRTSDDRYLRMTQFWGKLFLINFAIGRRHRHREEFQFGNELEADYKPRLDRPRQGHGGSAAGGGAFLVWAVLAHGPLWTLVPAGLAASALLAGTLLAARRAGGGGLPRHGRRDRVRRRHALRHPVPRRAARDGPGEQPDQRPTPPPPGTH